MAACTSRAELILKWSEGCKTFSFNVKTFLADILEREGWQSAPKGHQPDFSMHCAPKPLKGKPPPMHPDIKARAQRWSQAHPPTPGACIRMHCSAGLIALNDKVRFWHVLQSFGLTDLHPKTLLLVDCLADLEAQCRGLVPSGNGLLFLKQKESENGRDVFCFRSLVTLQEFVIENKLDKYASDWIIQEGIKPWLIEGRKPILRVFALVLGRQGYVHKEFLLKILAGKYSDQVDEHQAHVDCNAGQSGVTTVRGTDWQYYSDMFPKLCETVRLIVSAFSNILEPDASLPDARYSLIGFDFILTPDRGVVVLEANAPPSLYEVIDDTAKAIKMEVQEDFYRFVVLGGGSEGAEQGGFVHLGATMP